MREVVSDETTLSPVYLLELITQLPPESRFAALHATAGKETVGWGVTDYLLANVFDAIQHNTYVLTAANSKNKPKLPEPLPRPGDKVHKKNNQFEAIAAMQLDKVKKAKGEEQHGA